MEIEVRALLREPDRVEQELKEKGWKFKGKSRIVDTYYKWKFADQIKEDEFLRTRTIGQGDNIFHELCCKIVDESGNHGICDEYETKIDSKEQITKILETYCFNKVAELDKIRKEYEKGELKAVIDSIKDYYTFIEFEIDGKKEDFKMLEETAISFGIRRQDFISRGPVRLMMENISFD